MKKISFAIFALFWINFLPAQKGADTTLDYYPRSVEISEPPYALQKIKMLIKQMNDSRYGQRVLDEKKYTSLSLREKFTYNMIHQESFAQNCSMVYPQIEVDAKIYAYLPQGDGMWRWSQRQREFLFSNKDSVISYIAQCITKDKKIGLNFKKAIVVANAKEMIPLLIKMYNLQKQDHYILTVLMLLMERNEFAEFVTSQAYKKLYDDEDADYATFLKFNTDNEAMIIKYSTDFYNGLAK